MSEANRCKYNTSNCLIPSCGNGTKEIEKGEQCDDNNNYSNDGCSSTCKLEAGYSCKSTPPYCTPLPKITQIAFYPPNTISVDSEKTVNLPKIQGYIQGVGMALFELSKCDYLVMPPNMGTITSGVYTAPMVSATTTVAITCKMVNGKIKLDNAPTPKEYYVQLPIPVTSYPKVIVTVNPTCTPNGQKEAGEECDGNQFGAATCATETANEATPRPFGSLSCSNCQIHNTTCMALPAYCPTKVVNGKPGVYQSANTGNIPPIAEGCWFIGTAGSQTAKNQSCINVCSQVNQLSCAAASSNWTIDDPLCDLLIPPNGTVDSWQQPYSPVKYYSICKNNPDPIDCGAQQDPAPVGPYYQRLCKCTGQ